MTRPSRHNSYGPFNYFRIGSSDPQQPLAICSPVPSFAPNLSYHNLPPYYPSGTENMYPLSGMQPHCYMTSQNGSYVQLQQHDSPMSVLPHPINKMQVTYLPNEDQQGLQQQYILLHNTQAQVQAQAHVQAQALTSIPKESGDANVGDSPYRSFNQ